MTNTKEPPVTLEQLYPKSTPEEMEKIEETLDRYIELVVHLAETQARAERHEKAGDEIAPAISLERSLFLQGLKLIPEEAKE